MTPAQVAHIMSLVDELLRWKVINYSCPSDSSPKKLEEARAAVEAALREVPQAEALPNPGSPEASAMIDSTLAYYNWPANPKNAARAGYEAARRLLSTPSAPTAAEPDEQRYQLLRRGQHWSVIDGVGNVLRGDDLDAAIDSILAARASKGTPL